MSDKQGQPRCKLTSHQPLRGHRNRQACIAVGISCFSIRKKRVSRQTQRQITNTHLRIHFSRNQERGKAEESGKTMKHAWARYAGRLGWEFGVGVRSEEN